MKRSPMKRGAPLVRKTPLAQTSGRVSGTRAECEPNLRRAPIAPVSKKRARENRERTPMVAAKVEEQPWCTRCGKAGGILDPHEVLPRGRGGSITDPANVVIICRACHNWVTRHASTLAVDEGWSLPSWEKPA